MTVAALLAAARRAGLTVRRYGDRLALEASAPPPAELLARLRAVKPELLATLPDLGPTEPCPHCGGKAFWRASGTADVWACRRCVPLPVTIWTDAAVLP